jgi:hypothetical protein
MPQKRQPERAHWPPGLAERRPGYYTFRHANGGSEVVVGRFQSDAEAIAAAADLLDRYKSAAVFAAAALADKRLHLMKWQTYYRASSRARIYKHDLMSREEYEVMWMRSGGKCELTGITFSTRPEGSQEAVWPWGASIDRLDNARGYEPDNCRLVCIAMNLALHQFGEGVFDVLTRCYVEKKWARSGHPRQTSDAHADHENAENSHENQSLATAECGLDDTAK